MKSMRILPVPIQKSRPAFPVVPSGLQPSLIASGQFTVAEFPDRLGLPAAALNAIIVTNRAAIRKPFYNSSQLAERWEISRAQVYNILREADFMKKRKGNPRIIVTFEKDHYEQLKQFCDERGMPIAEAIRRTRSRYLDGQ